MKIGVLNQIPSGENLFNELNSVLAGGRYTSLRILMAYVSWDGISMINNELEKFYESNNTVEMIIGLSDGVSDPDTLRYLIQRFPKSNIWAFHTRNVRYTFHPKVYLFENTDELMVFIGSNNFTSGGLFYNSECCMKLHTLKKENPQLCAEVNAIWDTYKSPHDPFSSGNIKKINHALLGHYAKSIKRRPRKHIRDRKVPIDNLFANIILPSPPVKRMKRKKFKSRKKILAGGKTLLMQVLNETGADGTQVQIPRDVISTYFDLKTSGHQTIELQFIGKNIRPAVVCHFDNNTHRISFPEVASCDRPLLLKFIKLSKYLYSVELIRGRQYKNLITVCTKQTRYGAKKWAIV